VQKRLEFETVEKQRSSDSAVDAAGPVNAAKILSCVGKKKKEDFECGSDGGYGTVHNGQAGGPKSGTCITFKIRNIKLGMSAKIAATEI